jgi:hypothetical protein
LTSPATPAVFGVYFGCFADTSYGLWWDDDHLVYERFSRGYQEPTQLRLSPSNAQWLRFWRTVDRIDLWSWRARYEAGARFEPDAQTRDGTHWSVTLTHAGRRVETSGDSAGPGAVDLDESSAFAAFLDAVSRLIGGRPFG